MTTHPDAQMSDDQKTPKIGAQVKILKPKPGTIHRFEGKIGVIVDIDEDEEYVEVKFDHDDRLRMFYQEEFETI